MTSIKWTAFVILLTGLVVGCEAKSRTQATNAQAPTTESPAPSPSSLTLVADRSLVCMVNNQFMGQPQIPIEVDGRTYYGCCEMCKGRLGSDPATRVSTDPVTGKTVDKATAVIGRDAKGQALYFENNHTFATYTRKLAKRRDVQR